MVDDRYSSFALAKYRICTTDIEISFVNDGKRLRCSIHHEETLQVVIYGPRDFQTFAGTVLGLKVFDVVVRDFNCPLITVPILTRGILVGQATDVPWFTA